MKSTPIKDAAKKSFLAFKDPYNSVEQVFPEIIDEIKSNEEYFYTGVKNVLQIPHELLKQLKIKENYLLHTLDSHAIGGRAVDMQRNNPISGRPMTGSSSGTAINVFLGINDLGIGTDGGGSVLAPAMSLNLYGFISSLICEDYLANHGKKSTDNISFTPSIGYMTRTYSEMKKAILSTFDLPTNTLRKLSIGLINDTTLERRTPSDFKKSPIKSPNILGPRKPLIEFLNTNLPKFDFIISEEGPIDFYGLGDSVLGHFDNSMKQEQEKGNKGLIRVVNMANATAITVPKKDFASAYVLICESKLDKINNMLAFAENLKVPTDKLIEKYFRNFNNYFSEGFNVSDE
jgi:hypothetical protein